MVKGKSKRVVYLDTVKFLAIWMVCIGNYGFSLNSKSLDIFFPHAVVYVAVWVFLFEFVSENILGLPETKDHSTISSCRFYHFIDYICLLSYEGS